MLDQCGNEECRNAEEQKRKAARNCYRNPVTEEDKSQPSETQTFAQFDRTDQPSDPTFYKIASVLKRHHPTKKAPEGFRRHRVRTSREMRSSERSKKTRSSKLAAQSSTYSPPP